MHFKKGALSLLLVLAMLTLLFAALFPATVAADVTPAEDGEIENFGFQTPTDFAVAAATTEMRFVFTIGSLDYTKAGFVFSFESYGNVEEPTVGAEHCYVIEATTAYKTINADGKAQPAPEERWWIAAKVTNIPQDEFNNWIYVRAFVTDGEGTRYSDAVHISPFEAHRDFDDKSIREYIGESSIRTHSDLRNVWTDVLQSGAKTFCPTQENPEGNDLYIEYSVLFSEFLTETYLRASALPNVTSGIAQGASMEKELIYWDPVGDKTDGGFLAVYNFTTLASTDPGLYPNIGKSADPYSFENYPHVGGEDEENPEFGWHRIGIVYHEEVTNVDAVKGGADAEYYLTVSLYIDGNLVSVLCANDNMVDAYDLKLYTAEHDGNGGITYTDVAETEGDQSVYVYLLMNYKYVSSKIAPPYCVFADCYATCGNDFVQRVTCVDNYPDYREYKYTTSDGRTLIDAPLYYRIVNDDSFPGAISLMSYNVEVYGGTSGNAMWDGRDPAKVAETILSESPDIVGLQEVNQNNNDHGWDETLNALATAGGYTRLEGGYTGRSNFEKNEILYKTSKFIKLAEGTKTFRQTASELSVPNDENANPDISNIDRIFHYAALQEKSSGKKILVVSTHLHYGGTGNGHEADDKLRRYEISALLAWLETQRATYPDQIVMGDMNAHYKSGNGKTTMDLYTDGDFERTNSAAVASVRGDIGGTLAESGRTTRPQWIFDYILTKGNIKTAYYTVVDNKIDNGGTTYPSDHVPILAKIYLR